VGIVADEVWRRLNLSFFLSIGDMGKTWRHGQSPFFKPGCLNRRRKHEIVPLLKGQSQKRDQAFS